MAVIGWLKWGSQGVRLGKLDTLADALSGVRELARFSQVASEFLTALAQLPIAQGKLLRVTLDATTTPNFFPHGLGRSYRGVIVLGQSQTPGPVLAWDPATTARNNVDPSSKFMLRCASASSFDVTVWIF